MRLKSWSAAWLLLGLALPLLFLLDFCVQQSESRAVWLTANLSITADGADPLLLAADLEGRVDPNGLEVRGGDVLREDRYPWRPIPAEGTFMLRLDRRFLEHPEPGLRTEHFAASYRVRQVDRADGFGTPEVPCTGDVEILELATSAHVENIEGVRSAELEVDLVCTSAGRDLIWKTGDERGWIIRGTLSLTSGRRQP